MIKTTEEDDLPCPRCGKSLPRIEGDGIVECQRARCGQRVAIVWVGDEETRFHAMSDAERQAINRKRWHG